MRVIRGLPSSSDGPVALTIGNFDGVHRGHQAMLSRLTEAAEDLTLPSAVLTFDPPPREFFAPGSAPPRVSSLRSKLECFANLGVARTIIARFGPPLACLSPDEFIAEVLVRIPQQTEERTAAAHCDGGERRLTATQNLRAIPQNNAERRIAELVKQLLQQAAFHPQRPALAAIGAPGGDISRSGTVNGGGL